MCVTFLYLHFSYSFCHVDLPLFLPIGKRKGLLPKTILSNFLRLNCFAVSKREFGERVIGWLYACL